MAYDVFMRRSLTLAGAAAVSTALLGSALTAAPAAAATSQVYNQVNSAYAITSFTDTACTASAKAVQPGFARLKARSYRTFSLSYVRREGSNYYPVKAYACRALSAGINYEVLVFPEM